MRTDRRVKRTTAYVLICFLALSMTRTGISLPRRAERMGGAISASGRMEIRVTDAYYLCDTTQSVVMTDDTFAWQETSEPYAVEEATETTEAESGEIPEPVTEAEEEPQVVAEPEIEKEPEMLIEAEAEPAVEETVPATGDMEVVTEPEILQGPVPHPVAYVMVLTNCGTMDAVITDICADKYIIPPGAELTLTVLLDEQSDLTKEKIDAEEVRLYSVSTPAVSPPPEAGIWIEP